MEMVKNATTSKVENKKILLDGFPRTVEQARLFPKIVGVNPSLVLWLTVDDDAVLVNRIIERGKASNRSDDNEETVKERIKTYRENVELISAFYEENCGPYEHVPIVKIDAGLTVDQVYVQVKHALHCAQ
jgi:adenylate kinase